MHVRHALTCGRGYSTFSLIHKSNGDIVETVQFCIELTWETTIANRPIFLPSEHGRPFVPKVDVQFLWFPGLSVSQKQKSIDSLHSAAGSQLGGIAPLEISSKSRAGVGIALSAFNLKLQATHLQKPISVECAFQDSKVFERGGPYVDLFNQSSRDAKRDERLKNSGELIGFRFGLEDWDLLPQTSFYDWLYLNAVAAQPALLTQLLTYRGFTDIEFNPNRSLNCQAASAAMLVALHRCGLLDDALTSQAEFHRVLKV